VRVRSLLSNLAASGQSVSGGDAAKVYDHYAPGGTLWTLVENTYDDYGLGAAIAAVPIPAVLRLHDTANYGPYAITRGNVMQSVSFGKTINFGYDYTGNLLNTLDNYGHAASQAMDENRNYAVPKSTSQGGRSIGRLAVDDRDYGAVAGIVAPFAEFRSLFDPDLDAFGSGGGGGQHAEAAAGVTAFEEGEGVGEFGVFIGVLFIPFAEFGAGGGIVAGAGVQVGAPEWRGLTGCSFQFGIGLDRFAELPLHGVGAGEDAVAGDG